MVIDFHVNREVFMTILGEMWSTWTTQESLIKAAKRCGISSEGLNVNWMQQHKFASAALILDQRPEPSMPARSRYLRSQLVESPDAPRHSNKYLKVETKEQKRREMLETSHATLTRRTMNHC